MVTYSETNTQTSKTKDIIRKYKCKHPDCNKYFTTSGHASRHFRTVHKSDKPHKCEYHNCNMRFSRHDNMIQHYRTHFKKPKSKSDRSKSITPPYSSTNSTVSTSSHTPVPPATTVSTSPNFSFAIPSPPVSPYNFHPESYTTTNNNSKATIHSSNSPNLTDFQLPGVTYPYPSSNNSTPRPIPILDSSTPRPISNITTHNHKPVTSSSWFQSTLLPSPPLKPVYTEENAQLAGTIPIICSLDSRMNGLDLLLEACKYDMEQIERPG
ncbi:hypothetical protein BKA69DRAFT_1055236 [Paraphysoderma sedebokerense]|nr:hypothetical protein BKA69DRAFT_1055236 [Paraphysoderma sedebokerense]